MSGEVSHSTSSQPSDTQISTAPAFNSENDIEIGSKSRLSNTSIHNKDSSISDVKDTSAAHLDQASGDSESKLYELCETRVCTWLRWSTGKKDGSSMGVSVSVVDGSSVYRARELT